MDDTDIASINEEIQRDAELQRVRSMVRKTPRSSICLECGVRTQGGARWCAPDKEGATPCRDFWQLRKGVK